MFSQFAKDIDALGDVVVEGALPRCLPHNLPSQVTNRGLDQSTALVPDVADVVSASHTGYWVSRSKESSSLMNTGPSLPKNEL